MLTRRALGILVFGTALTASFSYAAAQTFPSKSIAIVVHTGPGGPFDTLARRMAELLSKNVGWQVRVENREGGTGVIALNAVMRQPADGHVIIAVGNHTASNIALAKTTYTLDNLDYIGALNGEPSTLVVRKGSPFATLADYIGKLRSNPDSIRVGGSGTASNALAHFLLNDKAKVKSTWVPFTTAPEAVTALLGGHLDAAFLTPSSALAQIESGEFVILASSSPERTKLYPNVDLFLWRGFAVRAGTPAEIVRMWRDAFRKIQADPEWAAMMTAQRQEAYTVEGDALKAETRREIDNYKQYDIAAGGTK
jgi:putative tricarboxylic transport membrane protein